MSEQSEKQVRFIRGEIIPLKPGKYEITVAQKVKLPGVDESFQITRQFAVAGERFSIDASEIFSVFPPDLANGEFSSILPHVVFNRRTIPWERSPIDAKLSSGSENATWLGILLFNEDEAPTPEVCRAKDLVKMGDKIMALGSDVTDVGALLQSCLSYPGMDHLDYGEGPEDQCTIIDVPVELFNKIAPCFEDLPYLAHIREVSTANMEDHPESTIKYSLVLGNRVAKADLRSCAFLVSLENMACYLPGPDGSPSKEMPHETRYVFSWEDISEEDNIKLQEFLADKYCIDWIRTAKLDKIDNDNTIRVYTEKNSLSLKLNDKKTEVILEIDGVRTDKLMVKMAANKLNIYETRFVRLITYHHWSFIANSMGETFKKLAEGLNATQEKKKGLSSLQYPFQGDLSTPDQVKTALGNQARGNLSEDDALVLLHNAFTMGYVPLEHHLRHGGQTVSWYRGPMVPYHVEKSIKVPISCPDAASLYNPSTGMFDVSYSIAWQLGQLLALQNIGYATALYNWKRGVQKEDAVTEEMKLLHENQGDNIVFESFLGFSWNGRGGLEDSDAPLELPDIVVKWMAALCLLNGIPFQYLVPDEAMLPPESLRLFHIDPNWIDAVVDGAFSIGRANTTTISAGIPRDNRLSNGPRSPLIITRSGADNDARLLKYVHRSVPDAIRSLRLNPRPMALCDNATDEITGLLLRSQLVFGWKRLIIKGYADDSGDIEVPILRMARLSENVLICLFRGVIRMISICEPTEQLHMGVEMDQTGQFKTTLRYLQDLGPDKHIGKQIPKAYAPVPSRSDGQTLRIKDACESICRTLQNDYGQDVKHFTSAEFALQMVKGSVEARFYQDLADTMRSKGET
jgi:hypothetical protein